MVINKATAAIACLALLLVGCTSITEHEMAYDAGLYLISSEDFSTITSYSDLSGASCLLIYPGNFFVFSREGTISRYNSHTLELLEVYQVSSPSPAGFNEVVFCEQNNSAYLIGSLGRILEIHLPDCTVLDEFSVCESPIMLAQAPNQDFLFVADGITNRIHQVAIQNNDAYDSVSLFFNIQSMEPDLSSDSMLVATSGGLSIVEILSPTNIRSINYDKLGSFLDIACVPDDSVFVGITDGAHYVGILDIFVELEWPPSPMFYGTICLEGEGHILAMGQDWQHVYILSYLGDGISRLISYNYLFFTIDQMVEIPGHPLDLGVSGNGVIYVLTSE